MLEHGLVDFLPSEVNVGWIFTPEGMLTAKRWAAVERGICVNSEPPVPQINGLAEAGAYDVMTGQELAYVFADDEVMAGVLVLGQALKRVEEDLSGLSG